MSLRLFGQFVSANVLFGAGYGCYIGYQDVISNSNRSSQTPTDALLFNTQALSHSSFNYGLYFGFNALTLYTPLLLTYYQEYELEQSEKQE